MSSSARKRDWRNFEVNSPLHSLLKKAPLAPSSSPNNFVQRSNNSSSSLNGSTSSSFKDAKLKSVAEPTTIWKIMVVLLMHVCKKILFLNLKYKVIFYFCATVLVSMVTDHFPPPVSFLSDPASLLNTVCVRYAWTWTCALNACLIFLTCSVYHSSDLWLMHSNLVRVAVAALWWWLQSQVSLLVAERYGICLNNNNNNNSNNINNNIPASDVTAASCSGRWISFAISDRTFVMLHCLLISLEEARTLLVWEKLHSILLKQDAHLAVDEERFRHSKEAYVGSGTCVKVLVLLITCTVLFLDLEFVVSLVYFNNMPQKLVAVVFAILGWLLTYKSWFRSKPAFISSLWSPGVPGNNQFICLIDR